MGVLTSTGPVAVRIGSRWKRDNGVLYAPLEAGEVSGPLYFVNFPGVATIPPTAVLNAVEFGWEGFSITGVNTVAAQLLIDGQPVGDNYQPEWDAFWHEFSATNTAPIPASALQAPGFGFMIEVESALPSGPATAVALVKSPWMRIHYT